MLLRSGVLTRQELRGQTLAVHRAMSCWHRLLHLRTHVCAGPPIRVVDRSPFDALLLRRARDAGAEVIEGERVTEVSGEAIGLSSGRRMGWSFLVGADGAGSLVRRRLGLRRSSPARGAGVQAIIRETDPARGLQVHFGLVPWGYGWVFPRGGSAAVGIGGTGGDFASRGLARRLTPLLQHAGGTGEETLQGAVIPGGPPCRTLGAGRVFLAGDAAGLVDRVSGEGIGHALESGMLVADAILEGWSRRMIEMRARRGCAGLVSQSRIFAGLLYRRSLQPRAMRRLRDDPKFFQGYWDLVAGRTDYWRMMLRFLSPI